MSRIVSIVNINVDENTLLKNELNNLQSVIDMGSAKLQLSHLLTKIDQILVKLPKQAVIDQQQQQQGTYGGTVIDDDIDEVFYYNDTIPFHIQRLLKFKELIILLQEKEEEQEHNIQALIDEKVNTIKQEQDKIIADAVADQVAKLTSNTTTTTTTAEQKPVIAPIESKDTSDSVAPAQPVTLSLPVQTEVEEKQQQIQQKTQDDYDVDVFDTNTPRAPPADNLPSPAQPLPITVAPSNKITMNTYIETLLNEIDRLTLEFKTAQENIQQTTDQKTYWESLYYIAEQDRDQWKTYSTGLEKELNELKEIIFEISKTSRQQQQQHEKERKEFNQYKQQIEDEKKAAAEELNNKQSQEQEQQQNEKEEKQTKQQQQQQQQNEQYQAAADEIIELSKQMLLEATQELLKKDEIIASKDEIIQGLKGEVAEETYERRRLLDDLFSLREEVRDLKGRNTRLTNELTNIKALNYTLNEKIDDCVRLHSKIIDSNNSSTNADVQDNTTIAQDNAAVVEPQQDE